MKLSRMKRKVRSAATILQQHGLRSGGRYISQQLLEDRWAIGRYAEWRSDIGRIDNATFLLNGTMPTHLKSRFVLNSWESEARHLIVRHLPKRTPVIELGACIGVVSCTTNQLLANPTEHVVVEANPRLIEQLTNNRERNRCSFSIVHAAIGYDGATMPFYFDDNLNEGSVTLASKHAIDVPTRALASLLDTAGFEQASIICDIEGSEVDLIANEAETLQARVPWLMVELHDFGRFSSKETDSALTALGFECVERFRHNAMYQNRNLVGV